MENAQEKNDRGKNVVVYGVNEEKGEDLENQIDSILAAIEEKPQVQNSCKVGVEKAEKCRLIKFTLKSSDHVNQILRKCKRLRDI